MGVTPRIEKRGERQRESRTRPPLCRRGEGQVGAGTCTYSRMEQFDQLLTCCICLDRYRTPKLLPCQHSYCLDPCMEGLVDYVKRQVKCPECRAEHRIPYNGIQGFPTNYTLQKFLELHAEITGELPDLNADAVIQDALFARRRPTSIPALTVIKRCVTPVKTPTMTSSRERSPESTIKSREE